MSAQLCEAMVTESTPTGYTKRRCYFNAKLEISGKHYCGIHARSEGRKREEILQRFDRYSHLRGQLRSGITLVLAEGKAHGAVKWSSSAMRALREAWEEARSVL